MYFYSGNDWVNIVLLLFQQSFGGASSSISLPHLQVSDCSTMSSQPRISITSASHGTLKQHAKVSPYVPKQELLTSLDKDKHRARSPKMEKLTPFELELSSAAAQGKLAYVSPTVRAVPTAAAKVASVSAGSISTGAPCLTARSHLGGRAGGMRLCVQQAGGAGMSQLSPVQLGQPVLLNTSQADVHG